MKVETPWWPRLAILLPTTCLLFAPAGTLAAPAAPTLVRIAVKPGLALREKPQVKSALVATIPFGETATLLDPGTHGATETLLGVRDAWIRIRWGNKIGFVFRGLTTRHDEKHFFVIEDGRAVRKDAEDRKGDSAELAGTAREPKTGLLWTRCPIGQTATASGCSGDAEEIGPGSAPRSCEALQLAARKWRAPTMAELKAVRTRIPAMRALGIKVLSGDQWEEAGHVGAHVLDLRTGGSEVSTMHQLPVLCVSP